VLLSSFKRRGGARKRLGQRERGRRLALRKPE
jgi:hypothetical protein